MMQNCLTFLATIKKMTGADEVTANYRGHGELFIRCDFTERKFTYLRAFSSANWLTIEDEENDLHAYVEETLTALKAFGRKPNAQLDTRPKNTEINP